MAPSSQHEAGSNQIDIAHHIANSHELETPFGIVHLPDNWKIPLGTDSHGQPRYLDLSPTKHLVYMLLAAVLVTLALVLSARSNVRSQARGQPPKGFPGAMEAMVLWVRQEVVLPNVGHHGEGYAPYLLTVFFFVLAMNLLGLLPVGCNRHQQHLGDRGARGDGIHRHRADGHADAGVQGLHEDDLLPSSRPARRRGWGVAEGAPAGRS